MCRITSGNGFQSFGLTIEENDEAAEVSYMGILRTLRGSGTSTTSGRDPKQTARVEPTAPRHFDLSTIELRQSIYPYVKHLPFSSSARQSAGGVSGSSQLFETSGQFTAITKPLYGDLMLSFAITRGHGLELVQQRHLHEWSVSEFQLQAMAEENLKRLVDARLQPEEMNDLLMLTLDGQFEASLLTSGVVWNRLGEQIGGDIVVAVPASDVVVATSANDPGSVARMRDFARQVRARSDHPLSDYLYRRVNGDWMPLDKLDNLLR